MTYFVFVTGFHTHISTLADVQENVQVRILKVIDNASGYSDYVNLGRKTGCLF